MNLTPWRGKRQEEDVFDGGMSRAMTSLRSEMDRLFDRFMPGFLPEPVWGFRGTTFLPSVDVTETENEILVRAEVPGIDPKELNVTLSGQMLTLSGEKKESAECKGENCYQAERRFGSFHRVLQLPTEVNPDNMTAEHKNGVVHIRLKKQPGAVAKRIPVQAK